MTRLGRWVLVASAVLVLAGGRAGVLADESQLKFDDPKGDAYLTAGAAGPSPVPQLSDSAADVLSTTLERRGGTTYSVTVRLAAAPASSHNYLVTGTFRDGECSVYHVFRATDRPRAEVLCRNGQSSRLVGTYGVRDHQVKGLEMTALFCLCGAPEVLQRSPSLSSLTTYTCRKTASEGCFGAEILDIAQGDGVFRLQ